MKIILLIKVVSCITIADDNYEILDFKDRQITVNDWKPLH